MNRAAECSAGRVPLRPRPDNSALRRRTQPCVRTLYYFCEDEPPLELEFCGGALFPPPDLGLYVPSFVRIVIDSVAFMPAPPAMSHATV